MTLQVLSPRSLPEALEMKAAHPDALPIAGGTDVMVGINFGHLRPAEMLDVSRLPELREITWDGGIVTLGAGVTYGRVTREMRSVGPLVQASRSVGSPQIRMRGTIGGNLGTASPAGDALPVLAAFDAEVEIGSASRGTRRLPWHEFLTGPKKNALQPDELILGARWKAARGSGSFSKIGTRNAMVIAVIGLCLVMDEESQRVKVALGSVGPTILRAREAEEFASQALAVAGAWEDPAAPLPTAEVERFARLVASAARPIDDIRGTADYRRHACAVLARRSLVWALEDRRTRRGTA